MAKVNVLLLVAITIVALSGFTFAKEWTVGDDLGWTSGYDYMQWADYKDFHVGDVLVFNYDNEQHNVLWVEPKAYETCSSSSNWGTYNSGSDRLTLLDVGFYFFICQYHCDSPQKLVLYANPTN